MFAVGLDVLYNLSIYITEHSLFETELILSSTFLTSLRSYSINNSLDETREVIVGSLLGLFMASLACLSTKRRASSFGHHGRHGHHGYQDTNQQNFYSNFYKRCSKIAASTQRLQFILFFFS